MITIITGTETGTAEYVSDEIQELLQTHNLDSESTLSPNVNIIQESKYWIICTSTHGAGEIPENLKPFAKWLEQQAPDLSSVKFGVIALGDSSYDTYCQAGKLLFSKLNELNGQPLFPIIEINAMDEELPEDIAIEKITPHLNKF